MSNFDLPLFLVAFAGGIATAWTLVLASRAAARNRPRMSVSRAKIGPGGLNVTLRNEGSTPATDIELRVAGEHDGTIQVRHDVLGPGAVVELADVCPAGRHFAVEVRYRYVGGESFVGRRSLQRSAAGPLRIVTSDDQVVRRRLRDWGSDMLRR